MLDPIWTTSSQTTQHAFLVYDTLFGLDAAFRPQPQMLEGFTVGEGGRSWRLVLRDGLACFTTAPRCWPGIVSPASQRWGKARPVRPSPDRRERRDFGASDDRTIDLRMKYPFPVATALGKSTANVCVMMPERLATTDAFRQVSRGRRQRPVPLQRPTNGCPVPAWPMSATPHIARVPTAWCPDRPARRSCISTGSNGRSCRMQPPRHRRSGPARSIGC